MSKPTLKQQQKYWFSNQWKKAYLIRTKKMISETSIAWFEPVSFSGPVQIQIYPLGHLAHEKELMWKYNWTTLTFFFLHEQLENTYIKSLDSMQ